MFRLAAIANELKNKSTVKRLDRDKSQIVIAAFGESTTQSFYENGRDISWPRHLEEILNFELKNRKSASTVRVLNLGVAGTSTPFLVRSFRKLIATEKPDVVITMMGINDGGIALAEHEFWYEHSYLVRFVYWAREAWACPKCYKPDPIAPITHEERYGIKQIEIFMAVHKLETLTQLGALEAEIRKLASQMGEKRHPMQMHAAWIVFHAIESPRYNLDSKFRDEGLMEIERLLEDSRPAVSNQNSPMILTCLLALRTSKTCLPQADHAIANGLVPSEALATFLAPMMQADKVDTYPHIRDSLLKQGLAPHYVATKLESARKSYFEFDRIVSEHKISWFAMQYPTMRVAELESLLPPSSQRKAGSLVLVSNENFNVYSNGQNPEVYFTDFFGRATGHNFGHTTDKGHELIARNLATEILRRWNQIELKKTQ